MWLWSTLDAALLRAQKSCGEAPQKTKTLKKIQTKSVSHPSRKEHQEKNGKNGKQPESELKRTSGRCLQTVLPGCWSLCLTIYVSIVVGPSVHISVCVHKSMEILC